MYLICNPVMEEWVRMYLAMNAPSPHPLVDLLQPPEVVADPRQPRVEVAVAHTRQQLDDYLASLSRASGPEASRPPASSAPR